MPDKLTLCVTGGRDYTDKKVVFDTLDQLVFEYFDDHCRSDQVVLIVGGARGADKLAEAWAKANDYEVKLFEPDWNKYGKAAGPLRNIDMINEGFDFLVSFPGGRGTIHMTTESLKAGRIVYRVREDGTHDRSIS
jgi:hypothetical protein